MKIFSFLLGLLLVSSAFAFQGHWQGKGDLKDSKNLFSGPCKNLEFQGELTQNVFTIKKFVYQCGLFDSDWIGLKYIVDGENLLDWESKERVGHIRQNELLLVESGGVAQALKLTLDEKNNMSVVFLTTNIVGKIEITGTLAPK